MKVNGVLTEPFSDTTAFDIFSDSSISLSGSVAILEESDLFFRIDFDRRCVSTFGDVSDESSEAAALSSNLPVNRFID